MSQLISGSRLRRIVPALAILITGLGIASALIATTPKAPQADPEERAHAVSVQIVDPAPRSPAVAVYGRVEAASITELEAPASAPVAMVHVREGDWVTAGDMLVELDASEARLELRAREADLRQARADLASLQAEESLAVGMAVEQEALAEFAVAKLARFEELHARQMVARALLDEVREEAARARMALARHRNDLEDFPNRIARQEAALARAEVAAERARMDLQRTRITAPFSGPVLAVHVARGNQVLPGAPLVRLADAASFEVRAPLPTEHVARIRPRIDHGPPVTAVGHLDDVRLELSLARLAGAQKDGRTGIDAFFSFDARPGVELGRVVDLRVGLPVEPDLVALPVQAIYENNRIYRVENERLVAMDVEVVGESETGNGYRMLVRSPELRAGQRVITTQLPQAMTGLKVAPVGDRIAGKEPPATHTPPG